MPTVSFAVLNYNNGRFLRDCLDSIVNQQGGHDFEVIVVDDASTDDSGVIAASYSDPRIRFIWHERNVGHIATVNDALAHSSGKYIARLDSDDRYRPDFLTQVLEVFQRFPDVGLVYGDAAIMNDESEISIACSQGAHGKRDFKGNELVALLEKNFICAPTVIARREAWERTLPAPEGLAFHDWYFTVMMARDWDFYYLNRVIADYRVHAGNWHATIIRNRQEEPSILRLLDQVFREIEPSKDLERAKQQARRRVYGAHYLTLADKYFGYQMNEDARRCYLRALGYRPSYMLRSGVQRRLAATIFGRDRYEAGKALIKSALVRG